jgi:hypothetical protein
MHFEDMGVQNYILFCLMYVKQSTGGNQDYRGDKKQLISLFPTCHYSPAKALATTVGSSRRISYDHGTRQFQQHEDNPPNLTAEAKKNNFLTEVQKTFIADKAPKDGQGYPLCPSKTVILAMIQEGYENG